VATGRDERHVEVSQVLVDGPAAAGPAQHRDAVATAGREVDFAVYALAPAHYDARAVLPDAQQRTLRAGPDQGLLQRQVRRRLVPGPVLDE